MSASGILSEPLELLRSLIAGTSEFQTWTSTASSAAAKLRIHPHEVDVDGIERPFAVVQWMPGAWVAQRGGYVYGSMRASFESEISAQYRQGGDDETDYFAAALEHANDVGAIVEACCKNSEASGAIHLSHDGMFTLLDGPNRCREEDLEGGGMIDFYQSIFRVDWGIRL